MKKILLFGIMLLWAGSSWGQLSYYTFASSSGSYTEITGGTVLGTIANDEQRFVDPAVPAGGSLTTGVGFPIGFNFSFDNVVFDRLAINTNGWISLGQSSLTPSVNIASSSAYTPISSTTAITPALLVSRVVGLGRDIQGQTGAEIRIQTIGVSPNQECVIQWKGYKKYGTTGTGDNYNFQIRLLETTNQIKFIYGVMTNNATGTTVQVGIRATPANPATNYANRTTTTSWGGTTAGAAANATCTLSSSIYPASGLTFTYIPPVIIVPPNCAANVSPPDLSTMVPGFATLNWTAASGWPTGYKLYFGTNNPPTNIVNGTNLGIAYTYDPAPDMSFSTTYYWKVVAFNANGDATGCSVWSFTTGPDPTITTFPACESFDGAAFSPYSWVNVKTAGTGVPGIWDRQTAGTNPTCAPHSGAGMARYNSYSLAGGTKGILVTVPVNFPAFNYKVKFWMYRDGTYSTTPDLVNVYYNTIANLAGTPILLGTVNRSIALAPVVAADGWYQYEFLMPASAGGNGRYVVFEAVSAFGNNIFLDDVCFESYPPASLVGHVYDYNGNPLPGATISKVDGISTLSGINGDYVLIPLISGSQQFKCSKTGYNDVLVTIDIPGGTAVTQDFTLTNPLMAITPPALYDVLLPTETSTINLYLTNDGNGNLDWQAGISYNAPLALDVPVGYCAATGGCDESISRVQLNGIDNTTSCSGYGDFTNLSTDMSIGNPYLITVTNGNPVYSTDQCGLWVDWNQNGAFDIDESISMSGSPGVGPYTAQIIPPAGAKFGETRLRIRIDYNQTPQPCGTTTYGEVEDYTVNIPSWLTLEKKSDSVAGFGEKDTIPVHFDATKADEGSPGIPGETYKADLVFESNPDLGGIIVPVTLAIADEGLVGPSDLTLSFINAGEGKFMLKWKENPTRAASHFIVLRSGQLLATTTKNSYIDVVPGPGSYCYKVARVYENGGVSVPAGPLCIDYPLAPGVPLSNWALVLGGLLIGTYAFYMMRKRS